MAQINYNQGEASRQKEAKTYNNFTYDYEITTQDFNELKQIMGEIQDAFSEVSNEIENIKNIFDEFTDFDDRLNSIKSSLANLINSCDQNVQDIIRGSQEQVEAHKQVDTQSQQNVEELNSNISRAS